jgi:uncharacterized surface protein with fasciclin (FAS1) repeats
MHTRLLALLVAAALPFTAACGTAAGAASNGAASNGRVASAVTAAPGTDRTAAPSPPIGPGCKSLPSSGPGSPKEIAHQPLATAASHIPDLSTLVTAAKKAGLIDTLNSVQDITVFAPTDEAFRKIPKDRLNKLLADRSELGKVIAYHVVQGRKTPAELERGDLTTMEGGKLSVHRSGDTLKAGDAQVVCGALQTRNATVYMIDSVLKPGG